MAQNSTVKSCCAVAAAKQGRFSLPSESHSFGDEYQAEVLYSEHLSKGPIELF